MRRDRRTVGRAVLGFHSCVKSVPQDRRVPCCKLLAWCDMATLYLRNVPDELSRRLARLAAKEGLSVSSFAVRELGEAARRAENPGLLGELPDFGVSASDIVADVEAGRSAR